MPKARPRVAVRNGRAHAYTPSGTAVAEWQIRQAALAALGGREPFDGAVAMLVTVVLPMPKDIPKKRQATAMPIRRPDADNFVKLAIDACDPLWRDDAQIVELAVRKVYGSPPRWEIEVAQFD